MADAPINPDGLLHQDQLEAGGSFVRGPLWADFKRALAAYAPPEPDSQDAPHVASQKAFEAKGWRNAIGWIEKIPFESQPAAEHLIPKTLLDQRD